MNTDQKLDQFLNARKIELDEEAVDLVLFALARANHTSKKHDELEERLIKWKNGYKKEKPEKRVIGRPRNEDKPIGKPPYLLFREGMLRLRKISGANEFKIEYHFGERSGNKFSEMDLIAPTYLKFLSEDSDLIPRSKRYIKAWIEKYDKFIAQQNPK